MALRYVGAGQGAAADNIPARDLSDSEVSEFGGEAFLLALKIGELPLYEKVGGAKAAKLAVKENEAEHQPGGKE